MNETRPKIITGTNQIKLNQIKRERTNERNERTKRMNERDRNQDKNESNQERTNERMNE